MGDRDYSGVSTAALAAFVRKNVKDDYEVFADVIGINKRNMRRIFDEEYQFTGLAIADRICNALGVRVDDEFDVIPASTQNAAKKMAKDELEVMCESHRLPAPTAEDIAQRASELEALRVQVLGAPTQEQIERLQRDGKRTKDRISRQRADKRAGLLAI